MHTTRESWLLAATEKLRPRFKSAGLTIPKQLKVSCGFPGKGSRKKRIGECWPGKTAHIFITPMRSVEADVLEILTHELIHACLPPGTKHGALFKTGMAGVGLEGKATATNANEDLLKFFKGVEKDIGPYPHVVLSLSDGPSKQTTRLLKVMCPSCSYIARVTRKTLDEHGPPICPTDHVPFEEA